MKTKNQFKQIFCLTIILSALFFTALPCLAAPVTDNMAQTIKDVSLPGGGENPEAKTLAVVGKATNIFFSLLGVVFFILIVYGGFKWLLAQGREEEVKKAKEIITGAIIGLAIILTAYAITYFVVSGLQSAAV